MFCWHVFLGWFTAGDFGRDQDCARQAEALLDMRLDFAARAVGKAASLSGSCQVWMIWHRKLLFTTCAVCLSFKGHSLCWIPVVMRTPCLAIPFDLWVILRGSLSNVWQCAPCACGHPLKLCFFVKKSSLIWSYVDVASHASERSSALHQ